MKKMLVAYKREDRYKGILQNQAGDVLAGLIKKFEVIEKENPRWNSIRILKSAIVSESEYLTPPILGRAVSRLICKHASSSVADFNQVAREILSFTRKIQVNLKPTYKSDYFESAEDGELDE